MVVQACRVCLSTEPPLQSFSENNVKTAFEDLIGCLIDLNKRFPKHVCGPCKASILQFVGFKKWCQEVQDLLHMKATEKKQITKKFLKEISSSLPARNVFINQSSMTTACNKGTFSHNTESFGDGKNDRCCEEYLDLEDHNKLVKADNADISAIEDEPFIKAEPELVKEDFKHVPSIPGLAYEGFPLKLVKSDKSISDMIIKSDDIDVEGDNDEEISQKTANDKLSGQIIPDIVSPDDNEDASSNTDNVEPVNKLKTPNENKLLQKHKRKTNEKDPFKYKVCSTTITKDCKSNDGNTAERLKSGTRFLLKDKYFHGDKEEKVRIKVEKWQCGSCKYVFLSEGAMQQHLKICNTDCSPCGLCGANFRDMKRLYEHMAREHKDGLGDGALTCFDCDMKFKKQVTLHKHWIHVHREKLKRKSEPVQERPPVCKSMVCYECGKQFRLPCLLRKHMMKHTGERPFKCDVCHKSFRIEMTLRTHKFVHSGEKPFKCTSCSRTFRQPSHLRRHIRTHTGEKPYTCPLCHKGFTQDWNRDEHVRTVHEGLPPKPRPGKLRKRHNTNRLPNGHSDIQTNVL